ncbi:N-acetyltransferase [Sandaracinobacteroides saxicola]|uniref:N-acetyltransferase n=1 Tax=Sandaracinobacteroides saxicola TaxID=2759707 RepID=A0A7G5IKJ9_9SPHN|nr:N-acetyltransferase [Sandaracinobacteroides saxicola]QMW23891.1 N-acetyltransferase [Sandaracinobacteroides saxicola]
MTVSIRPVLSGADRKAFVDLAWRIYGDDPAWVPPLKSEVHGLIAERGSNPWFEHGEAAFWLAERDGVPVGRVSAQVDRLVQERRPGLGQWGFFDYVDDPSVGAALIATAEAWLRGKGMTIAQGPLSLGIWDEPGLLVSGFDTRPTVMMGHHRAWFERDVLAAGYRGVRDLHAWELDISKPFPPLVQRIVAAGEKGGRIRIREIDKARFAQEAALVLSILNEAWSENWGFVPLTDAEVAYVGKKLKPIVFADLVRIAEYDGEPVAFMITLPDVNELTADLDGRLFPFGWAKLLWRLRKPKVSRMRVPLMGVRTHLQGTRAASMMAFMMIEYIRRASVANYGATRGEIGWILEDNEPMRSIAKAIDSEISRTYRIFEKPL